MASKPGSCSSAITSGLLCQQSQSLAAPLSNSLLQPLLSTCFWSPKWCPGHINRLVRRVCPHPVFFVSLSLHRLPCGGNLCLVACYALSLCHSLHLLVCDFLFTPQSSPPPFHFCSHDPHIHPPPPLRDPTSTHLHHQGTPHPSTYTTM